jgi:hypothetical protein
MKKLLLASILLMVFGASAQAVVVVDDPNCSGDAPNITCISNLTCGTPDGTCTAERLDFTDAICAPILNGPGATRLTADNELNALGPVSCTWEVTDTSDNNVIQYTIDNSNGLPVELQSLSVE